MVERNQSVYWDDDEDESDYEIFMSDNNESSRPSAQSYLNEEPLIKNFTQCQQGGDTAGSSNSWPPIGLKLNKTPSFLNMVQMSVFKEKSKTKTNDHSGRRHSVSEKLKAGNFPATSIKIGSWQRFSMYEGDLTAKLYYAKRKLVWEVLEGGLKYKIEMQWSNISAIRGIMPENEPGILEVELSQPPSYFQELNPQPRKHTLWKEACDFTGGQAPIWRRHIVSFKPGILDKHYEKLLQCNQRLFDLSLKPFPSHESPYFDPTFGISGTCLSFSKPYESSYYQGLQYSYLSYSAPPREPSHTLPSMPAINLAYTNEGGNMDTNHFTPQPLWDEGPSYDNQICDHNSQYPNYYQPPTVGVHEQSHVPSSLHDHGAIHVEPSTGSLSEPTDMINQGYSYDNNACMVDQYQDAGNSGLVADGFYARQQDSWNTQAQQYTDNIGVMNYQGSSSLDSYYYPGYSPSSGDFF